MVYANKRNPRPYKKKDFGVFCRRCGKRCWAESATGMCSFKKAHRCFPISMIY